MSSLSLELYPSTQRVLSIDEEPCAFIHRTRLPDECNEEVGLNEFPHIDF